MIEANFEIWLEDGVKKRMNYSKDEFESMQTVIFHQSFRMTETNSALDVWDNLKMELDAVAKNHVQEKFVVIKRRAPLSPDLKIALKKRRYWKHFSRCRAPEKSQKHSRSQIKVRELTRLNAMNVERDSTNQLKALKLS